MKAHPDILTRFQQQFFEEFGERLSDLDALDRLTRLTNILRVLVNESFTDSRIHAEDETT